MCKKMRVFYFLMCIFKNTFILPLVEFYFIPRIISFGIYYFLYQAVALHMSMYGWSMTKLGFWKAMT